ncbi:MAG: protein kinase [Polyangia bacterium]
MSDILPERIGPYRIVRKLGEGGMGVVFEAIHETISRRVAIKLLNPEFARNPNVLSRFFNEARAVNLIDHPGLVQVSDLGQSSDGTAYIVMELLKGETLTHRLQSYGGRMPVPQVLLVAWQIADALATAHSKGIVHRDLKPDNIMLVPDSLVAGGERAKLLDFGIAKLMEAGPNKTTSNMIMGTPRYMSPEQCRGAGQVDEKTDVYSLGVMLYQMLTGRTPFEGEGSGDLIIKHVMQEPPPLQEAAPTVPVALCKFVHLLLTKDRTARPAMATVVRELSLLRSLPATAKAEPQPSSNPALIGSSSIVPTVLSSAAAELPAADRAPVGRHRSRVAAAVLASTLLAAALLTLRPFSARRQASTTQPASGPAAAHPPPQPQSVLPEQQTPAPVPAGAPQPLAASPPLADAGVRAQDAESRVVDPQAGSMPPPIATVERPKDSAGERSRVRTPADKRKPPSSKPSTSTAPSAPPATQRRPDSYYDID